MVSVENLMSCDMSIYCIILFSQSFDEVLRTDKPAGHVANVISNDVAVKNCK